MQPFTTDTQDTAADHELDEQLRRHVLPSAGGDEELDYSRRIAARALDDAIATEARRLRPRVRPARRRSVLAAIGGIAASLLVAGALAPGGGSDGDGSRTATTPFGPGNASAAEVLEQAAQRMLATGADVGGTGSAWHAIAQQGEDAAWESWYDADKGAARWAMYSPGIEAGTEEFHGQMLPAMPATYYVLDVHSDGTGTIRQYERTGSGPWRPQQAGSQMNASGAADSLLWTATLETEAIAWLRAVDGADDPADLRAANLRFVEKTHMWFAPPAADPTLGGEAQAARAMQTLYLLRIARLEPAAVAQLYRDVIDIQQLARLDDGEVDGRKVARLRLFDPPEGPGGEQLASVLLLDLRTGEALGIEAVNGTARELYDAPRRTDAVGDGAISCGRGTQPPCELLRGEGAIAAAANRIARDRDVPMDPTPAPAGDDEVVANEPAAR